MICLALGLGILGAVAFRKARRCHHGFHGHYGHDHYGWGGPPWARHHRRGLYMAFSHLDASPAQERAIIAEVDKLRERAHTAKRTMKDGRGDLAAAIRGAQLDDAALGALLGRIDGASADLRAAAIEALRNIHGVLDDRQRSQLADLLDQGWWRRGAGGPYRV